MIDLKPWGELNHGKKEGANVCIMAVPFDGAVSCGKGAALGPEVMRGLSRYLPATTEEGKTIRNIKIYDAPDVEFDLDWVRYYKKIEEEATELFHTDKFCFFLGGDHSVTIPLQKSFHEKYNGKKIGIIHFDSHADICDEYDSHKWSHACTERRALEDIVKPSEIAFLGLRSWEQEELDYFRANPECLVIKAYDVFKEGYLAAYKKLETRFKDFDAIYFSLDIDVLDPAYAPGTGTPEAGGLSSRELIELTKLILRNLPIKAMDLVEVSPPLDAVNNITSWAALKVMYEVFGCLDEKYER